MSACDCMLGAAAPAAPASAPRQPAVGADDQRIRALARAGLWADVHAHPGRCFLAGLEDDEPFVRLMGPSAMSEALEDVVAGNLGLVCVATVGDLRVLEVGDAGIRATGDFEPGEAQRDHHRQLAALDEWLSIDGVRRVLRGSDLDYVTSSGAPSVVVTCEGADFLEGSLDGVEGSFDFGARSITLVHYRVNELGDIQTEAPVHGGLTRFGADVVREMNRLGMVIDLAHATESVTRDVLDISSAPVMISHSHLASGPDSHPRLLSLEHAQIVARAGGLVGAWPAGVAFECLDDFIDEIMRMVDLLGVGAVAIGTDMDANYRPVVGNYRQYPSIALGLLEHGMAEREAARVLGGNALDLFRKVLA